MRKSAAFATVAVLIVAGAAGYVYARQRAQQAVDSGIATFRASLPPGATFSYATATPDLFARAAHLTDVALSSSGVAYTAAAVDVAPGAPGVLRHLSMAKLTAKAPTADATADDMQLDGVTLPPGGDASFGGLAATVADHAVLHGLHMAPHDGGSVDLASFTADSYGPGRATTLDAERFAAAIPDTAVDRVTVGKVHLRGLLLADVIARAKDGTGLWPHSLDYTLTLSDIDATASAKPFVHVSAFESASDPKGGDKYETRIDLNDLEVDAQPALTPGLVQLGYQQMKGALHMHALVDRAAHQLRMDRLDLDGPQVGTLHLALGLDNVPFEAMDNGSSAAAGMAAVVALAQAQLQALEIVYEDHGLAPKARAWEARQGAMSVEALAQVQQAQVDAVASQLHLPAGVAGPVRAFVAGAPRLAIAVKPPQPIPLMSLQSIGPDPAARLGLLVTN